MKYVKILLNNNLFAIKKGCNFKIDLMWNNLFIKKLFLAVKYNLNIK